MIQALYIGAGLDIVPVLVLKDIKKFIYIDSQPFSDHGTSVCKKDFTSDKATIETREIHEEDNLFGRTNFKSSFHTIATRNSFTQLSETKYCGIYKNQYDQIIKYHMSCSFPEFVTDEIREDIAQCNTLILCGYSPNKVVLTMMKSPDYVIANCHTVYTDDESEDSESTISYLVNNPTVIKGYYLLKEIVESLRDNFQIISCKDLNYITE